MTEARLLIDTNVLVYADDARDARKQAVASEVLQMLLGPGPAGLTTQVLGEYWRAITKGAEPLLSRAEATTRVRDFATMSPVFGIDVEVTLEAARLASTRSLAYWDAQLIATAKVNGVGLVLSEDFTDGIDIDGVIVLDPFASHFDVEALLA